jgi:sugar/nucleoside kinase (ribokinase family)
MGCVGDDFEKQNLTELAQAAGLDVKYQTHPKLTTGRCAVLINTKDQ